MTSRLSVGRVRARNVPKSCRQGHRTRDALCRENAFRAVAEEKQQDGRRQRPKVADASPRERIEQQCARKHESDCHRPVGCVGSQARSLEDDLVDQQRRCDQVAVRRWIEHGVPKRLRAQPDRVVQLVAPQGLSAAPVREQGRRSDQGQSEQREGDRAAIEASTWTHGQRSHSLGSGGPARARANPAPVCRRSRRPRAANRGARGGSSCHAES